MRGLMMDTPLLLMGMLRHAATAHGMTEVVPHTIGGNIHHYSYRQALGHCRRLSLARDTDAQSSAPYSKTTTDGTGTVGDFTKQAT